MSDAHKILTRRLCAYFDAHGLAAQLASSRSEHWASATFSGARHRFMFQLDDDGMDAQQRLENAGAAIPETEFALPGHIVADIAFASFAETPAAFAIEALTVEAG